MSELVDLTMREASNALAAGDVSATELLEATFERIAASEPAVHAYASVMTDQARAAAARSDAELAAGEARSAIHGIPVAVKDLLYTVDAPTEAGSRVLGGFMAPYDATVVRRLRDAGAVIVGKTVTHEFAYVQDRPATRSPWLENGFPGGSSAGSGVAVAARSAFGGIGTDTAGSIRLPAALNGITGLKPTYGRVSRRGVVPMAETLDTVGPMARSADDCGLLLAAIEGIDPGDPSALDADPSCGSMAVEGLRLGFDRDYFLGSFVRSDIAAVIEAALAELVTLGIEIIDVRVPALDDTAAVGLLILLAETSAWHRRHLRADGDLYVQGTRVMLELGELVSATAYINAQRSRRLLAHDVRAAFEKHAIDGLVGPTSHTTTASMDVVDADISAGNENHYLHLLSPANVLGLPALTLPCGFSEAGLPVGLQLIGRPLGDGELVAVGRVFQAATDWHEAVPPPLVEGRSV